MTNETQTPQAPPPAPGAPNAPSTEVKCAECGKPANVSFTPDPSRPVFCRDCFSKRRTTGGPRGGGGGRGPPRGDFGARSREPRQKGVGSHGFSRFDYPGSK